MAKFQHSGGLDINEGDTTQSAVTNTRTSEFEVPDLNHDVTVHDVQNDTGSFSEQWGFVCNPEFSVRTLTVPLENSNGDLGCSSTSSQLLDTQKKRAPLVKSTKDDEHQFHCVDDTNKPTKNIKDNLNTRFRDPRMCSRESEEPELVSETRWYIPRSNHHSLPLESSSHEFISDPIGSPTRSRDDSDFEQSDKISNSVKSMWNNFKNGFTLNFKSEFKYNSPLWLLGHFYHCSKEEKEEQKKAHNSGKPFLTNMDEFKIDFSSRIWFTYRKDFCALPQSSLTTDLGWGCMLRSGQMMMAHALVLHLLGRDWRYQTQKGEDLIFYRKVIQFFTDAYSTDCPFSLHKLVEIGIDLGKNPGDWYGPASVAHVLSKAMIEASVQHPLLANLCVYVAQDCTVYIQDIVDMCTQEAEPQLTENDAVPHSHGTASDSNWRACVILIPVRLGGVDLNEVYIPCLRNLLAYADCLGIIGGKTKHSLYFVGWQEEKSIYLDPHFCQEMVDPRRKGSSLESYHCNTPRKMSFSKLDPSCTIGFYCRTRADFDRFIVDAKKMVIPPMERYPYPMFVFQDGRAISTELDINEPPQRDRVLKVRHYDREGRAKPVKDSDDFVFLEA